MEKAIKKSRIPQSDSIQELAEFWDTHDSTDFEDELEEVTEPVFVRRGPIQVHLGSDEAQAVEQIARAEGVSPEEVVRAWVLQELAQRRDPRPRKQRAKARRHRPTKK
jgi:CopG antitoxin of type II toxin-antitoxin system